MKRNQSLSAQTRRAPLLALTLAALLLSGCGGAAAEQRIEEQRDKLAEAEEISFTVDLRVNLETEVFDCTLQCAVEGEKLTAEALAPAEISGIRAVSVGGETSLEYENIQLSVGTLSSDPFSPMTAMPLLLDALREGHIIRAWTEGEDTLAAEVYAGEEFALTMWFRRDTLEPLIASFSQDGTEYLRCGFREFAYR